LLVFLSAINIPIAILGAGDDTITPPEVIKQFERVLAAKPGVSQSSVLFVVIYHDIYTCTLSSHVA
jgi:alpha-beta hydrolase superfamily lysophospholipase